MSSTPRPSSPNGDRLKSSSSSAEGSDVPSFFTVTSSSTVPAAKHSLNPAAKAFEVPLFAAPAGPRAADYTTSWAAGAQRTTATLDDAATQQQLEDFVRKTFGPGCVERGQHMVLVFNLEQRTNRKQLSSIFFPMGASEAVVMEPSDLPPQLAAVCQSCRRRVGVVFFPRKDFAMVGVEKINDFVPNGQHQPLTVRYCGPDAEGSSLSGAALPTEAVPWMLSQAELTRVQADMWDRYGTLVEGHIVVAVHGLDPDKATSVLRSNVLTRGAVGCEPWPPRGSPKRNWCCRSMSAVVWFPTVALANDAVARLDGTVPVGQAEPLALAVLKVSSPTTVATNTAAETSADSFAVFDEIDQHILRTVKDYEHLVGVHNLAAQTQKSTLFKIFYPMGAMDAEVLPDLMNVGGKQRRSGVAFFSSEAMAREAASKIHNFVPHGQSRPLVARYLCRSAGTGAAAAPSGRPTPPAASLQQQQQQGRRLPSPASTTTTVTTAAAASLQGVPRTPKVLLQLIKETLAAPNIDADQLTEMMKELVLHEQSGEADASALAEILSGSLLSHNALLMSTPLSSALMELHRALGIRRPTSGSAHKDPNSAFAGEEDETEGKAASFVLRIARSMMMLLLDNSAQREARRVAAVLCAYFFEYSYLPGTPCTFAVKMLRTYHADIQEAKKFLAAEACTPMQLETEQQNRPWVTLVDCLEEMTSLWRRRNKTRAKKDENVKEYDAYVADFYGATRTTSSGSGASTPRMSSADTSVDHGVTLSSKRSATITPSARPTPRRVITRTPPSSGSGSGGKPKQPAAAASEANRVAPQVTLSPSSEHTQGVSADISTESNVAPFVAQTLRNWAEQQSLQNGGVLRTVQASHHDNDCTVYITKMPSCFTSAQVRRLLLHFGEFNKVRLCREDKESMLPGGQANGTNYSQLCFGFIEFAESSSAKAMVEYFRNAAHNYNPFVFLRQKQGDEDSFSDKDIKLLCGTRTSQARNRIHDQQRLDVVLRQPTVMDGPELMDSDQLIVVRPCLFGIVLPNVTIENYTNECQQIDESVFVAQLQPYLLQQQQQQQQQQQDAAPMVEDVEPESEAAATADVTAATTTAQSIFFPKDNRYNIFSTNPTSHLMAAEEEYDDVMQQALSAMQTSNSNRAAAAAAENTRDVTVQDNLTAIMAQLDLL